MDIPTFPISEPIDEDSKPLTETQVRTFLTASYIVEEMGMEVPLPFDLQMDNEAARIFCMGSAAKTRLKHIDCRQEFVRLLRSKDILRAVHVPSKENLADLMTKILPRPTFEYLVEKYFVKYKFEKVD